ncbi:MAG: fluoride efflux transporter CrcB [Dehalococcoidia bacterium]|nr:fluoride efflux transporter CrcB [Dehalococcoidia bacterium]
MGGALGALARYGVARALVSGDTFPVATLAVNFSGALLLGFLSVYLVDRIEVSPALRNGINGGFIGAYTTFSTFSLEAITLAQGGRGGQAVAYLAVSIAGGLALAWLGQRLAG